jgi:hypothetical protein
MATLYFNAAVDADWDELGNWWTNSTFTSQAASLPTSADSVVLSATCDTNSGSEPTVVNLTIDGSGVAIGIALSVTGVATFNDSSLVGGGSTITGNAVFNDSSYNAGTVTGNATFNDDAYHYSGGVVGSTAVFNDRSFISGGLFTSGAQITMGVLNARLTIAHGIAGYAITEDSIFIPQGINGSSILGVV